MLYWQNKYNLNSFVNNIITCSMDCQLADVERKHGVKKRWLKTDQEYIDARKAFLIEKQTQLHSCLWAAVVKRHYLLCMKAKYAGELLQCHNYYIIYHQYYSICLKLRYTVRVIMYSV